MQSKKENETDAKSKRSADKPPRWFKTVEPLKGCKMKNKNRSESKKKRLAIWVLLMGKKQNIATMQNTRLLLVSAK